MPMAMAGSELSTTCSIQSARQHQQQSAAYTPSLAEDQAGNIDNLTPRSVDRAWLYDGQVRVDNQTNPTVNAYAGLKLKYPHSLPSSYPMSSLQLQRASDNLTVNGQWNLDNDSLVFWSTGPLEKRQTTSLGYRAL